MLRLTFEVHCPSWCIQGIKEALAMFLEKWGDVRLVSVEEKGPEQVRMDGFYGKKA